jgi:hypothetical protein
MLKLDNGIDVDIKAYTDGLIIEKSQHIPTEFLDRLRDLRHDSMSVREREFQHVAAIPVALVDRWLKEGYDVYQEPIRKTVAKLKHENLEYFLATAKNV